MGFRGRTAAHKPKITMYNANVGWSDVKHTATGLLSEVARFTIWQLDK